MNNPKHKLTLDRPATYEITVPEARGAQWIDWNGITTRQETDDEGLPITIVTGTFDQAGLQGFLRRLYGLGSPIISVICIAFE